MASRDPFQKLIAAKAACVPDLSSTPRSEWADAFDAAIAKVREASVAVRAASVQPGDTSNEASQKAHARLVHEFLRAASAIEDHYATLVEFTRAPAQATQKAAREEKKPDPVTPVSVTKWPAVLEFVKEVYVARKGQDVAYISGEKKREYVKQKWSVSFVLSGVGKKSLLMVSGDRATYDDVMEDITMADIEAMHKDGCVRI